MLEVMAPKSEYFSVLAPTSRKAMALLKGFLFAFILFTCDTKAQSFMEKRVTLQTSGGIFVGNREKVSHDSRAPTYFAFKGIPYARPPIGEMRWKEPKLLDLRGSTHQATSFGSICPQWSYLGNTTVGNEDCLFLNVFTPSLPVKSTGYSIGSDRFDPKSSLPVLVYVHGGSFMVGSSDLLGPRRFMQQNVILVTVNYRLGVFGFLSTGDNHIDGNFGLMDIATALTWVHHHIKDFGGDPGKVTIFGHSAGAALVHYLMLSPRSSGLFNGAILQSGSAFCDWSIQRDPLEYLTRLGEQFGCEGSTEELVECFEKQTSETLISAQDSLLHYNAFPIETLPVIDDWRDFDAFLPKSVEDLTLEKSAVEVPVMLGVVENEGLSLLCHYLFEDENILEDEEYFREKALPSMLKDWMNNDDEIEKVSEAVFHQYFGGGDFSDKRHMITELQELIGDQMFYKCHWKALNVFAKHWTRPAFSYVFTHSGESSSMSPGPHVLQSLKARGINHPLFRTGVAHSDELLYLFSPIRHSAGIVTDYLSATDERMADIMTKTWTAFAKNGNPNEALSLLPTYEAWEPLSPSRINYYNLTSTSAPMGKDFHKGQALFWLRTIPHIREMGNTLSSLEIFSFLFWVALASAIMFLLITVIFACILCKKRRSKTATL